MRRKCKSKISDRENIIRAYRETEKQIDLSSDKLARDFNLKSVRKVDERSLRGLYKVLLLPEDMLEMYVKS
jgi:hypothetical protein